MAKKLCHEVSPSQRERVKKDSRRLEIKRKFGEKREALYIYGGTKSILLDGTQAMPARPYEKE
jgi:hypothetical protein